MHQQTTPSQINDDAASTRHDSWNSPLMRSVCLTQAGYYGITGIWPLVSINTFQMVTGPKRDLWLVKTVGVLISVIGGVLAMAGYRRRIGPETAALAMGSALSLTAIDVVYVSKRRIAPIYLLDALGELVLVAAWALAWAKHRHN